jgi:hypothetical protein
MSTQKLSKRSATEGVRVRFPDSIQLATLILFRKA